MIVIGSNNPDIYLVPTVNGDKVDKTLVEQIAAEHPEIAGEPSDHKFCVIKCRRCGQLHWSTINGHVCKACSIIETQERVAKRSAERVAKRILRAKPELSDKARVYSDEENLLDHLIAANNAIIENNSKVLCPFYNEPWAQKTWCAACKRGVNWNSGTQDVSSRRCPDHPIAADGKRCILRTTYRKDAHSTKGYSGGQVVDYSNMSEDVDVQLEVRGREVDR